MTQPLDLGAYRSIVVLTGAGISVASGLPTYRGTGGLWDAESVEKYVTARAVARDPEGVWEFFGKLRRAIGVAVPNAAHRALAEAEALLLPSQTLTIITQNVDGLHQAAGSQRVIEFHGSAWRSRCTKCDFARPEGLEVVAPVCPPCPSCGSRLRPDIVFFEEEIPADAAWEANQALGACDLFLAVGTSGAVWPASDFVRRAYQAGARTVYVSLEPLAPPHPAFQEEVLGPAEVTLPLLLG